MLRAIDLRHRPIAHTPSSERSGAQRSMDRATIDGWRCAIGGAGDGTALSGGQLPAPVVPGVIALPLLAYLTAIDNNTKIQM